MKTLDEHLQAAALRTPFSNGSEFDAWYAANCAGCRHGGYGCPLLALALSGYTPAEWTETNPGGLADRYACSEREAGQ